MNTSTHKSLYCLAVLLLLGCSSEEDAVPESVAAGQSQVFDAPSVLQELVEQIPIDSIPEPKPHNDLERTKAHEWCQRYLKKQKDMVLEVTLVSAKVDRCLSDPLGGWAANAIFGTQDRAGWDRVNYIGDVVIADYRWPVEIAYYSEICGLTEKQARAIRDGSGKKVDVRCRIERMTFYPEGIHYPGGPQERAWLEVVIQPKSIALQP